MPKICFVSYCAYSLFNQSKLTHIGGSEVRAWLFAKGLSQYEDFKVSFVVADEGAAATERYGAITVYHHPVFTNKSFPILDPSVHEAFFNTIDAEIFIIIGVHDNAYEVMIYCEKNNKKFVLMSGSDLDHSEEYTSSHDGKNIYSSKISWCHDLLKKTQHLICQTQTQKIIFENRFGLNAQIISNPVELTGPNIKSTPFDILWIGRSDSVKRPEIVLQLAKLRPKHTFVMIMNLSRKKIHEEIWTRKTSNVTIIDYVPYHQITGYLQNCQVLLNTSEFEGLPNAFLQAGINGKPILSMKVDPNDMLSGARCGLLAGDNLDILAQCLDQIFTPEMYTELSENVSRYVNQNHNYESQSLKLANYLRSIGP